MDWMFVLISVVTSIADSHEIRWAGVLDGLDAARAEAFAQADPKQLDRVYVDGSAARAVDAALIADYAGRGGRVVGAELDLLSCNVRRATGARVSLEIVDQLAAARVEWDDGSSRALPRDQPTRRVVVLVRTSAGWRIA